MLIAHPKLQQMELHLGSLDNCLARAVATATLPSLTQLCLNFGHVRGFGRFDIEALAHLWTRPCIPKLTSLALRGASDLDEILVGLLDSPLLRQLTRLDLSEGNVTDRGVDRLCEAVHGLGHLEQLTLPRCAIAEQRLDELLAAGIAAELRTGEVIEEDDD